MARAATAPPSLDSAAAARGIPARSLSMGRWHADDAGGGDDHLLGPAAQGRRRESTPSHARPRGPRSPVAALAQPAFTTTARALAPPEVLARDQDGRGLGAVRGEDPGRRAGPVGHQQGQVGPVRLDPASTAAARKPSGRGDAHRARPPRRGRPRVTSTAFTSTGMRSRVRARTRSGRPKSRMKPSASLWS